MKQEENEKGKVWLAGAGPGDAALLTVKTRELMEQADVVVYDALVSLEILSLIPEHVEMICVGKRAGNHPVPQSEINEILAKEAMKGKCVLRLKGGDPFVFGRGGEEIERLLEDRIPYEVVPGVTSAAAVPAYNGIPLTHRDYTSSFHVITGHARKGKDLSIPYEELVKLKGTLVFLMGISSLPMIVKGLLQAGMDPNTEAAVLEKGTTAKQRRVTAALEMLEERVSKAQIRTPAIIVVGKVCKLADTFAWEEARPLSGKQILLTRPRQNISKLASILRKQGAHVIEMPSIETRAIQPNTHFVQAVKAFGTRADEEWMIFTSPIGVRTFFELLKAEHLDIRIMFAASMKRQTDIKIAAIGKSTAKELQVYGLVADLVPDTFCAQALGEAIEKAAGKESAATIFRAAIGSKELLPPLQRCMKEVDDVALYETGYFLHPKLKEQISLCLLSGEIDAVTFTSASTVKGFVNTLGEMDYSKVKAICIGEQTALEAKQYGMDITISKEATMESLAEILFTLSNE